MAKKSLRSQRHGTWVGSPKVKKTDKGQHINLATGKPKAKRKVSDKAFDMMTAAADKTEVDIIPQKKGPNTEIIHAALAGAGFIPAVGNVADALDAFLYLSEGKKGQAALAGLSVLPLGSILFRGIGYGKKAGKMIETQGKISKRGSKILEHFDDEALRGFHESSRLVSGNLGMAGGRFGRKHFNIDDVSISRALHTTTSAAEASKLYGPNIIRLEIDSKVLRSMQEGGLVKKLPRDPLGRINLSHYIFDEGLALENIKSLKQFMDFDSYRNWLLKGGKITMMQWNKMGQQYFDF